MYKLILQTESQMKQKKKKNQKTDMLSVTI